jgi:hypothetical protein
MKGLTMRCSSFQSILAFAAFSLGAIGCSSSDNSSGGGGGGAVSSGGGGGGSGGAAQGGSTSGGGSTATGGSTSGGGSAGAASGGVAGTAAGGAAGSIATGGTGGGATGACTNADDTTKLNSMNVGEVVGKCAQDNLGGEPATRTCIKTNTNLSDPCVDCFDGEVQCGAKNCWLQCISDANSPGCIDCRKQYCDPAFETCSGLTAS